ncbi:hypothetical protein V8C86DRAFT_967424 [Haematococcus lacustris]
MQAFLPKEQPSQGIMAKELWQGRTVKGRGTMIKLAAGARQHHSVSWWLTDALPRLPTVVEDANTSQAPSQQHVLRSTVKRAPSTDDLLGIVQQHGPDLDFTHVSQALTRLSSLEDQGQQLLVPPETSHTQPQVQDPSPSVAITLARLDPLLLALLPSGDSRGVSNALWAYSRLNHYRRHTFDALCRQAMRLKGQLDPLDCAQIMQAFGTFRHYHPDLLAAIPQIMLPSMHTAPPRVIGQVLWGFARLNVPDLPPKALLEAACVAFQHNISSCCNKDVALMLWSLAKLQHYPGLRVLQLVESRMLDALFCRGMQKQRMQHLAMQSAAPELPGHANEVANANAHGAQDSIRSLQQPQQGGPEAEAPLVPQDIGNVLWAFGQLKYKAASLLDQLPRHLGAWLHAFNCADLCAVLYGYAHARHYHPGVLNALGPLLTPHLSSLSLKELVTVFWAFGIFQHRPPTAPLLLDGLAVALLACLERSRPQTLATLAKACANLRFRHAGLISHICTQAVAQLPAFTTHELAALLDSLSHLAHEPLHRPSPSATLALAPGPGPGPSQPSPPAPPTPPQTPGTGTSPPSPVTPKPPLPSVSGLEEVWHAASPTSLQQGTLSNASPPPGCLPPRTLRAEGGLAAAGHPQQHRHRPAQIEPPQPGPPSHWVPSFPTHLPLPFAPPMPHSIGRGGSWTSATALAGPLAGQHASRESSTPGKGLGAAGLSFQSSTGTPPLKIAAQDKRDGQSTNQPASQPVSHPASHPASQPANPDLASQAGSDKQRAGSVPPWGQGLPAQAAVGRALPGELHSPAGGPPLGRQVPLTAPELQLFQAAVQQCMVRLKPPSTPHPGASKLEVHGQEDLRYKELNSVLFSYLRVGLVPWDLLEMAEARGPRPQHQLPRSDSLQPPQSQAPASPHQLPLRRTTRQQQQQQQQWGSSSSGAAAAGSHHHRTMADTKNSP